MCIVSHMTRFDQWQCSLAAADVTNIIQPSLHFNGHFPDGPGLAGTRMSATNII